MIRYSFNTWNHSTVWGLEPSLPEQIAWAAHAGFDHVGLDLPSVLRHDADGIQPSDLKKRLEGASISCFELVPLSICGNAVTGIDLRTVAEVASAVGAQQVLCVVRGPVDAAAVDTTLRCATVLADVGVGLSIEFLPTIECDSVQSARRLIEAVGHPTVRMVIDTWHFFEGPSTWEALNDLPSELIGFVQFSDAPVAVSGDVHDELINRRVLPGEGTHELQRFCDHFLAHGKNDMTVSVEVLSQAWRQRPARELAEAAFMTTRAFWQPAESDHLST